MARKVIVSEFLTLDGVMESPGGEFHADGRGGWTMPFFNEEAGAFKFKELQAAEGLLLGRVTYQHFAAAWPSMTDEAGFADRMNSLPKYVVSTTLKPPLEWNATVLPGDLTEEVTKLKAGGDGDLLVFGSRDFVHTMLGLGLIDEFRLMIFPVVLGSGLRLFREGGHPVGLRLADSTSFSSGVVVLTYVSA